jgi:amidohydrolase
MKPLIQKIKTLAQTYFSETVEIRQHLHRHPELSFNEFKTSNYISDKLTSYGIPHQSGIVNTGIVVLIKGKNPTKKTIALRADMDALPITELNSCAYKSQNEGVMHACGHDVHCASMLIACKIINELKTAFEGTVKVIFQPGEEKLPGGASLMIKEGVLKNPVPQKMFAQHVFPSMETGKVGFKKGMYMASTDELYLTVKGIGGHAAMPAEYINPLLVASEILIALNREFMLKTLLYPTVLAFGKMNANGATNVIPDEVKCEGTFRTMNENWRSESHNKMQNIAKAIAKQHNANCVLRIEKGYPFLINDETTTDTAINAAIEYLGKENVEKLPLRMTAEDFAFFAQAVPSCFYRLGTGNKLKGITSGVHTATFDIDEKALEIGSGLLVWLALNELIQL